MADNPQRTQLIAGIFVLCGIVLLGGLVLEFGPLRHWMRRPYTVHAFFSLSSKKFDLLCFLICAVYAAALFACVG